MVFEVNFLFGLALVWLVFATVQDIRTREIANWLNFSLIIFALGFRLFYSMFKLNDLAFFYQGLIGFGIFFVLSELFYYGKMFAGGDNKLMKGLGAVLPWSLVFTDNLKIFFMFITIFLIVGAVYGFLVSVSFGFLNFKRLKKELKKQFNLRRKFVYTFVGLAFLFLGLSFVNSVFLPFSIFVFIIPYFYLYVKSIDEACMVRSVSPKVLTEGDWLYEDVKVGKKTVKATWDGLTKNDLKLLSRKKNVLVRYGIQFAPVFLISFVLLWVEYTFGVLGFLKYFWM